MDVERERVSRGLEEARYVASERVETVLWLALRLERPLLLEGPAGAGKTEVAKALAAALDTRLIRLQCYEGLDEAKALYEWNYPKQLLRLQVDRGEGRSWAEVEEHVFSREFLLERPLLQALTAERSPVLLIDEVDKADEEFEAFLLELLSDFQVSIPELGTVRADARPVVVLTSNRTRELSEALRRRCIYLWLDFPGLEAERRILELKVPGLDERLAARVAAFVNELRKLQLRKAPSVAETIDWALALRELGVSELELPDVRATLNLLLKDRADLEAATGKAAGLIQRAQSRA
jgi:MoxR-like ATPase